MTVDELYEKLRQEAEARRRALLTELQALEAAWGFPRSVLPRDERRKVDNEVWTHPVDEQRTT